jgi:hypothetical protein
MFNPPVVFDKQSLPDGGGIDADQARRGGQALQGSPQLCEVMGNNCLKTPTCGNFEQPNPQLIAGTPQFIGAVHGSRKC